MKKYFLAVDAGGTKLQALLFDEELRLIRTARAAGVNINISTLDEARANMVQCLDTLIEDEKVLQCVYITFVGPEPLFRELLEERCTVKRYQPLNEGVVGMLAGMQSPEGICAMAGTGSDVFCAYRKEGSNDPGVQDLICLDAVGGWGAVINDGGSGVWMGRKAMQYVERMVEGMISETLLLCEVEKQLQAHGKEELIKAVYTSPSPYRLLATLTRAIARAADAGDAHALEILRQAGEKMAEQTCCLIRRYDFSPDRMAVVCSGGAWKAHSLMFESFKAELEKICPGFAVVKPLYDQICGGVVLCGLENGMTRKEICARMREDYVQFAVTW